MYCTSNSSLPLAPGQVAQMGAGGSISRATSTACRCIRTSEPSLFDPGIEPDEDVQGVDLDLDAVSSAGLS